MAVGQQASDQTHDNTVTAIDIFTLLLIHRGQINSDAFSDTIQFARIFHSFFRLYEMNFEICFGSEIKYF